jgi:hypothetical protein
MKEGEVISKTKMIKFLTNKTQTMWVPEEKGFKKIALTTRYDGNEATIVQVKEASPYLFIRADSETQEFRLVYNTKEKELMKGSILPVGWGE